MGAPFLTVGSMGAPFLTVGSMGAPFLTVGFLPSRFRVPNIKSGARIEDRRSLMRSVKQSPFASNLTMNPLASKD